MTSDTESPNILEKKLERAKEIQKINDFFAEARCPVCGNKGIETDIKIKSADSIGYGFAIVRCCHCGMFYYERRISGYDAYHWKFDGSYELEMLKDLKNRTEKYLK